MVLLRQNPKTPIMEEHLQQQINCYLTFQKEGRFTKSTDHHQEIGIHDNHNFVTYKSSFLYTFQPLCSHSFHSNKDLKTSGELLFVVVVVFVLCFSDCCCTVTQQNFHTGSSNKETRSKCLYQEQSSLVCFTSCVGSSVATAFPIHL